MKTGGAGAQRRLLKVWKKKAVAEARAPMVALIYSAARDAFDLGLHGLFDNGGQVRVEPFL